jgi:hypothetical protein
MQRPEQEQEQAQAQEQARVQGPVEEQEQGQELDQVQMRPDRANCHHRRRPASPSVRPSRPIDRSRIASAVGFACLRDVGGVGSDIIDIQMNRHISGKTFMAPPGRACAT